MSPLDIVKSRDGSLSQTKLAAACFHFLIFLTVAYITWAKQEFQVDMWMLYATVAVGHSAYDKTLANIKDFKDKKLDMGSPGTTQTTKTTQTTQTTSSNPPAADVIQ